MTLVENYFSYQCHRFQILHPIFLLDVCLFVFKFGYKKTRNWKEYVWRDRELALCFLSHRLPHFKIQIRQSLIRANPTWRREFFYRAGSCVLGGLEVMKHPVYSRTESSWRPGWLRTSWSKELPCSIHVEGLGNKMADSKEDVHDALALMRWPDVPAGTHPG